jgi:hypothetical protein
MLVTSAGVLTPSSSAPVVASFTKTACTGRPDSM